MLDLIPLRALAEAAQDVHHAGCSVGFPSWHRLGEALAALKGGDDGR